jgi:hypothetical protein
MQIIHYINILPKLNSIYSIYKCNQCIIVMHYCYFKNQIIFNDLQVKKIKILFLKIIILDVLDDSSRFLIIKSKTKSS